MAPISRSALNTLAATTFPGGTRATAADLNAFIASLVESVANIFDELDKNSGYPSLNANGKVNPSELYRVLTDGTGVLVMDPLNYTDWVNTTVGVAVWTSMTRLGDRVYRVVNMGSGNLTINYPAGAARIVDLANSVNTVTNIVIASGRSKIIVDNGINLIFF